MPPGEARAAAFLLLHLKKGEFADLPPAPLRWDRRLPTPDPDGRHPEGPLR